MVYNKVRNNYLFIYTSIETFISKNVLCEVSTINFFVLQIIPQSLFLLFITLKALKDGFITIIASFVEQ